MTLLNPLAVRGCAPPYIVFGRRTCGRRCCAVEPDSPPFAERGRLFRFVRSAGRVHMPVIRVGLERRGGACRRACLVGRGQQCRMLCIPGRKGSGGGCRRAYLIGKEVGSVGYYASPAGRARVSAVAHIWLGRARRYLSSCISAESEARRPFYPGTGGVQAISAMAEQAVSQRLPCGLCPLLVGRPVRLVSRPISLINHRTPTWQAHFSARKPAKGCR